MEKSYQLPILLICLYQDNTYFGPDFVVLLIAKHVIFHNKQ